MFKFTISSSFVESFERLEKSVQKQVKVKLDFLRQTENPLPLAKKLEGYSDIFRFRTGNYRIVFRLEGNEIFLLRVKDRKDVYKEF